MYLKQYEEVKIMRITDLLSKESIRLDGVSSTKKETIQSELDYKYYSEEEIERIMNGE